MYDYCFEDEETGIMLAIEPFELLAFRGDDIENRESWAFHVVSGEKAKEILATHEENSFADLLQECVIWDLEDTPNPTGVLSRVKGDLLFCENNENIKFVNVGFEWVYL